MKIEAGKYYKTRDGRKVGPIQYGQEPYEDGTTAPWPYKSGAFWYKENGYSCPGIADHHQDQDDLVSEWHEEGLKHDTGKPIAGIMFEDFPNALSGVCDVATFGANKYKRSSWKTVSEAHQRYSDALARHLLAKGRGEVNDPESGLSHSYHIAWNSLAIAELEALNAS